MGSRMHEIVPVEESKPPGSPRESRIAKALMIRSGLHRPSGLVYGYDKSVWSGNRIIIMEDME